MEPKEYIERQTLDKLSGENPSIKDVADGVKMIYSRLWSKDEITALIVQTHTALCSDCPNNRINRKPEYGVENQDKAWYQKVIWALIGIGGAVVGYFFKN